MRRKRWLRLLQKVSPVRHRFLRSWLRHTSRRCAGGAPPRRRTDEAAAKPKPEPLPDTQDSRTGTAGYVSNSTSVATKSNTPLINIPQSVSVLTKNFIKDQAPLGLTDVTRYVPGVAVHQGEGNRDELVIRGVDSSANFFVNGIRDDVQIFRDLYNTQSIEVVKGPSALTFGRGAGAVFSIVRSRRPMVHGSMRRQCSQARMATGASRLMPGKR